jgi:hypothetical protein
MSNRFSKLTALELLAVVIFIVVLAFGFLSFKAWLLGLILGWFGVTLGFWKNLVIIVLIDLILGGISSSSKK